jgi:Phosphatidylinositol 3- and 4-kinase
MTVAEFHLAGQHNQASHGDSGGVGAAVNKLKSGGTISLGNGETLSRSDLVQQRGGGGALLAAVDSDDGARRVRLGVIGDESGVPKWRAGNKGATAELTPAQARSIADGLTESARRARSQNQEADAVIEVLEDMGWDPDDRNPPSEQRELLDRHDALTSGLVGNQKTVSTPWGDVVYGTRNTDTGPSVALAVVSDDADADWTIDDAISDGTALDLTLAQVRALSSKLRASAGEGQIAAVGFDESKVNRDNRGRFDDKAGGGGGGLSAWQDQEASADIPVDTAEVFRLGTAIAKIMSRDGTTVNDPVAFFNAAGEALEGSDVTPRQYIATLDRSYGTGMADRIEAALRAGDTSAEPPAKPSGPKLPDFKAPYAERIEAMRTEAQGEPRASTALSGGTLAEVTRKDWPDRSRTVVKKALADAGTIDAKTQTDAEELTSRVADVLGVRAPAVRRIGPTEVEMEFMPGKSGAEEYGQIAPKSVTEAPENANIGLLDYLTNNADRHTGNWTKDEDGNVYAIDHGLSFQSNIGILAYGPFALAHGFSIGKPKNVTSGELDRIRERLEALRGQFTALDRGDWFDGMIGRLDDVAARLEA